MDETIQNSANDPLMLAHLLALANPNIIRSDGNLYRFDGRIYNLLSDEELDALYLEFCKSGGITKAWKHVNQVIRAFLVMPEIKNIGKMNNYENLLCLANGVLDIHNKTFVKHPTEYYFDSLVNVDYDETAQEENCPEFIKYINSTFNSDGATIANIVRLGGYLLDTSCRAERMFLFDGNGANGKSVLINIFSMFFSEDQISPLSLDVLASNSFSKELLIKSRVNFSAEQKKAYLDSEEIKKIVTGDRIEVNRKFKVSLSFTPKTKIIVACNGLPRFNDTTHAIYRRMILFRFHNQYLNMIDYLKSRRNARNVFLKDPGLFEKIKKEKSAILNIFIKGLLSLRDNNYEFIESDDSVKAMDEFKVDSDTVREFLNDNYEASDTEETSVREIYENYKIWYRQNVQEGGVFKFRVHELGKRITEVLGVEGVRKYVYIDNGYKSRQVMVYPLKIKDAPEPESPGIADQPNFNI